MAGVQPWLKVKSKTIAAGTNNITGSYGTGAGSKIHSGLSGNANGSSRFTGLYICNNTATAIYLTTASNDDGTPASDGTAQEILILAAGALIFDKMLLLDNVFVRSAGSTISSGSVNVAAFGS